jgi:hypothetical protein
MMPVIFLSSLKINKAGMLNTGVDKLKQQLVNKAEYCTHLFACCNLLKLNCKFEIKSHDKV